MAKPVDRKIFSFQTRLPSLEALANETFDIAVIGGGITGAALARDAALRGLRVALFEAEDFAAGTSSGSSKLIHGGLRYLENFEFKLVRNAIKERELLKSLYAPLVKDLWFVFPTYRRRTPPRWKLNLGLWLYDSFSRFRSIHRNLNRNETLKRFSQLQEKDLSGSCVYLDSFAEDYRLVVELIKSAYSHGAQCFSRTKVLSISPESSTTKLEIEDALSKRVFGVRAKFVFNCAGPFSDAVRNLVHLPPALELTQGVHIITDRENLPIQEAYVLSDPKLGRILFAIPWNSVTYFGTTDTKIETAASAQTHAEDVEYILQIVSSYFCRPLTLDKIKHSWSAVRPLIRPKADLPPSAISREHEIEENPKNIFHVLGGKLTSHRLMAEEALGYLKNRIALAPSRTATVPLNPEIVFFKNLEDHIHYAIQYEMALSPLDFLRRRSSYYYENPTEELATAVADLFARMMGWSNQQKNASIQEVLKSYEWDQLMWKR